jgi:hypothetical protein
VARIVWVSLETPDRNGQGGQRRQYHQIRALLGRGHAITVFVPASAQDDRSIRELVPVIRPRLSIRGRPVKALVRRARRQLATSGWDAVVVSHHESWWLLPERLSGSAPVLLDVHNVLSYWHRAADRDTAANAALIEEGAAIRAATVVTTCSELERRRLSEMHPEFAAKLFAAPLGVDPLEWPDEEFVRFEPIVAMFGSWGWRPNALGLTWFLAEVWPRVRVQYPDAKALVAGSGVTGAEGWPDGAHYVGRVIDLAAFAASSTVLAVPVLEGVGASVKFAEALASGGAVVATPDGSNAFDAPPAFISADPVEWADWIAARLRKRSIEPAPALSRAIALRDLTWHEAVAPIDAWLKTLAVPPQSGTPVSS